jgi:tRNA (guanine37-N1)-methyltransferase
VRVDFITLFPEMVLSALNHGVVGRAANRANIHLSAVDPRDFCYDPHRKVDDRPFGGEPGMLLRAEPVALALESILQVPPAKVAVVSTDPTGKPFTQDDAVCLADLDQVVIICGHYEGIDQRVLERYATHSFSIGDYILTGGEFPALVMADAIIRNIPGVLGDAGSLTADSHSDGLLSAPNYTRPAVWRGESVPDVLLEGNHAKISAWRKAISLRITAANRPDLLRRAVLTKKDVAVLAPTED